jgi:hypothetical protein
VIARVLGVGKGRWRGGMTGWSRGIFSMWNNSVWICNGGYMILWIW